jgi:DNA-binding transcriptional LysR family regulator
MNIVDISVFNKVASTLSFTRAARQVGSSRSAVSKRITRLEQDLGVVLVNRSTRSVSLTEAGRTFYQHTSDVDTKIEHAAEVVRSRDLRPTGTVAFAIPSSLAAMLMPALITDFQSTWPELRLNIHVDDRQVDLIAGSFDLAIQIAQELEDSSLVSRRLASTRKVLAASPGYLDKFGVPTDIAQLKNHRCLGRGSAAQKSAKWRFQKQEHVVEVACTYSISANNDRALVEAASLDNGIVYLPEICIFNEVLQQDLQIILPEASDPRRYGIFAVYPHRNTAAKVKVLVDFIARELSRIPVSGRVDRDEQCVNSKSER